jgi:hypothetical protein
MYQKDFSVASIDPVPVDILERSFNYGPCLRSRKLAIKATLFGSIEKKIGWPRQERVGLIFSGVKSPVLFMENLLLKSGFKSPDDLRDVFEIPHKFLTCRALSGRHTGFLNAKTAKPKEVLRQGLILGFCGPDFYNPDRPVIWTNSRLTRKVDLYDAGDFYANN